VNKFYFSNKSRENLDTCHEDLITLFNKVIEFTPYDIGISYGHRTIEEQFKIFKKGRELNIDSGKWEIYNSDEVVTNCDGHKIKSKHNETPSMAIDFICYDENGSITYNEKYYLIVIGVIFTIANQYNINIKSGMNWEDYGHIELVKND
jgi:peptidoglycan L-alanyl-D-glutamate endopeptidase CwlK